jgi:hypothetical protein
MTDSALNVVNAELHALMEDFYESEDIFDRTLGYVLLRQADHLDGLALVERVREIAAGLAAALARFERQVQVVIEDQR